MIESTVVPRLSSIPRPRSDRNTIPILAHRRERCNADYLLWVHAILAITSMLLKIRIAYCIRSGLVAYLGGDVIECSNDFVWINFGVWKFGGVSVIFTHRTLLCLKPKKRHFIWLQNAYYPTIKYHSWYKIQKQRKENYGKFVCYPTTKYFTCIIPKRKWI